MALDAPPPPRMAISSSPLRPGRCTGRCVDRQCEAGEPSERYVPERTDAYHECASSAEAPVLTLRYGPFYN